MASYRKSEIRRSEIRSPGLNPKPEIRNPNQIRMPEYPNRILGIPALFRISGFEFLISTPASQHMKRQKIIGIQHHARAFLKRSGVPDVECQSFVRLDFRPRSGFRGRGTGAGLAHALTRLARRLRLRAAVFLWIVPLDATLASREVT